MRNLKRRLINWLVATKLHFIERWSIWRARKTKSRILHLDAEVLEDLIRSKDEFIIYLQDEVAWFKAQLREDSPERVRNEVEFKSSRGYKSIHTRIREQVLANKNKHKAVPEKPEKEYEQVEVND